MGKMLNNHMVFYLHVFIHLLCFALMRLEVWALAFNGTTVLDGRAGGAEALVGVVLLDHEEVDVPEFVTGSGGEALETTTAGTLKETLDEDVDVTPVGAREGDLQGGEEGTCGRGSSGSVLPVGGGGGEFAAAVDHESADGAQVLDDLVGSLVVGWGERHFCLGLFFIKLTEKKLILIPTKIFLFLTICNCITLLVCWWFKNCVLWVSGEELD